MASKAVWHARGVRGGYSVAGNIAWIVGGAFVNPEFMQDNAIWLLALAGMITLIVFFADKFSKVVREKQALEAQLAERDAADQVPNVIAPAPSPNVRHLAQPEIDAIMKGRGSSPSEPETERPISVENQKGLVAAIEYAAGAIGRAIGSDTLFAYDEAVASIAAMFRIIELEGIAVPELRKDGPKLGALRAYRYIQLVVRPYFLIGDEEGALRVAKELVPEINAMPEADLLAQFEGLIVEPPARPTRDISFKDALRHFAYKSRWAHDFEHPTGDWMTVVQWPQAIHQKFCQHLMDGDLDAWGIRRVQQKPRENGHSPIPTSFWSTAEFDVHHTLESPDTPDYARDSEGIAYSRIMFNRAQVEGLWPAVDTGEASKIEIAAKAWGATRAADVAASQAQMAAQVEAAEEAKRVAAEKMADPYREAVLRLDEAQVTKLSNGEHLTKVECHLRLTSRVTLRECCVWISELRGPETVPIDAFCRTGRKPDKTFKTDFLVTGGHIQPVALLKRDLADIVSNPPFLLLTDKGAYPLADNSEYSLHLELRSEAKYPTLVELKIVTGVKDVLDVSITNQTV